MNILDAAGGLKMLETLSPTGGPGLGTPISSAIFGKNLAAKNRSEKSPDPAGTAKEESDTMTADESSTALTRTSVLDQVVHTLFGRPNSEKTPQEQQESAGKRGEAGSLAAAAAKNPGAAFMGIPSGGSNEFGGGTIQTILQTLGSIFGGGGLGGAK